MADEGGVKSPTDFAIEHGEFGYPRLVDFMSIDEDNDFVVFRRFKRLQLYSLLEQQRRLIQMERKVVEYEGLKRHDLAEVLAEAPSLLNTYNMSLLLLTTVSKVSSPPEHLTQFFKEWSKSQNVELRCFINDDTIKDLISPLSAAKGRIHRWIDERTWLKRLFVTQEEQSGIQKYSEHHVRRAEKVLINVAFCVLVLVPVGVLPHIRNGTNKMIVIISAVLLTAVLSSGLSDRSHRSSLAIMAAYTAILVVFLGNTI